MKRPKHVIALNVAIARLGITQRDFAKKMGMSESAISKWKSGKQKCSAHRLRRLSEVLKIPLDEALLCGGIT